MSWNDLSPTDRKCRRPFLLSLTVYTEAESANLAEAFIDDAAKKCLSADGTQSFANLDGPRRRDLDPHLDVRSLGRRVVAGIGMGEDDLAILADDVVLGDLCLDQALIVLIGGKTDFGIGRVNGEGPGALDRLLGGHLAAESLLAGR